MRYDYAFYWLGLSHYAQGKMSKAEATLQQATEIQPNGYGYHLAPGAALNYQDKLPEAQKANSTSSRALEPMQKRLSF